MKKKILLILIGVVGIFRGLVAGQSVAEAQPAQQPASGAQAGQKLTQNELDILRLGVEYLLAWDAEKQSVMLRIQKRLKELEDPGAVFLLQWTKDDDPLGHDMGRLWAGKEIEFGRISSKAQLMDSLWSRCDAECKKQFTAEEIKWLDSYSPQKLKNFGNIFGQAYDMMNRLIQKLGVIEHTVSGGWAELKQKYFDVIVELEKRKDATRAQLEIERKAQADKNAVAQCEEAWKNYDSFWGRSQSSYEESARKACPDFDKRQKDMRNRLCEGEWKNYIFFKDSAQKSFYEESARKACPDFEERLKTLVAAEAEKAAQLKAAEAKKAAEQSRKEAEAAAEKRRKCEQAVNKFKAIDKFTSASVSSSQEWTSELMSQCPDSYKGHLEEFEKMFEKEIKSVSAQIAEKREQIKKRSAESKLAVSKLREHIAQGLVQGTEAETRKIEQGLISDDLNFQRKIDAEIAPLKSKKKNLEHVLGQIKSQVSFNRSIGK